MPRGGIWPAGMPLELRPKIPHCADSGAADKASAAAAAASTPFILRIILRLLVIGYATGAPRRSCREGAERWHSRRLAASFCEDRKSTRLNSSHANISYAVFCL